MLSGVYNTGKAMLEDMVKQGSYEDKNYITGSFACYGVFDGQRLFLPAIAAS